MGTKMPRGAPHGGQKRPSWMVPARDVGHERESILQAVRRNSEEVQKQEREALRAAIASHQHHDATGALTADDGVWSPERAFRLCSKGCCGRYRRGGRIPFVEGPTSVRTAAEQLNAGAAACDGDFCVIWSSSK